MYAEARGGSGSAPPGANTSAAASLDEGFEEAPMLRRLGLLQALRVSLKTTIGAASEFQLRMGLTLARVGRSRSTR